MPTGYTCDIEKGISFKEYATKCMRNFGALINMRDEPWDTPITKEKVSPPTSSSYHQTELEKAEKELEEFKLKSDEQLQKDFEQHVASEVERYEGYIKEKKELKKKYLEMLNKVYSFEPPTEEHESFHKFMIEQITGSIEHDCNLKYYQEELEKYQNLTFEDYVDKKLKSINWNIDYHGVEAEKEKNRTDGRWEWVEAAMKAIEEVENE